MKNWEAIASGNRLALPADQLAKIMPSLDALEAAFRPLASTIPDHIEPAITLSEAAIAPPLTKYSSVK
jgi:hypothetical protein